MPLDNASVRYIKVSRTEDDGAGQYWFSIYELYAYSYYAE